MRRLSCLLALSALPACLHNPATNLPSTGAPLRVVADSGTYQYDADVETGKSVTTDEDGHTSETVNYTTQTMTGHYLDMTLYEGDVALDEQDYYRLAGDEDAVRAIQSQRERAYQLQVGGGVAAAIGTVAAIAAYELAPRNDDGSLSSGGLMGFEIGSAVATLGLSSWLYGRHAQQVKYRYDLQRASSHADVVCVNGHCARTAAR